MKPSITLLTLIFFILINLLISPLSLRLDLSKGQAYTLSSSTKKIISNLDDIVNIKFFVNNDLPTRLLPLKTEVKELLNEYQKGSRGKIIVAIVDPKKSEDAKTEAGNFGIPELQFSQLEKDKYAVSNAYFGIGISYAGKNDSIAQVSDPENLEFNLTSLIYKLTRKEAVKIGVIGPSANLSVFTNLMSQQFDLKSITLEENSQVIDKDIKTLIIIDDNQTTYMENQISVFKKYLDNGGKAIVFVDGVLVGDNLSTSPAIHGLFSLLENYGIKINKNLVLSTSAELVNFGNGTVQYLISYPFWIKTNNFNLKTSYFSNINQLTFPWISSLTLNKIKGLEISEIARSSVKSWEQKNSSFNLNPETIPDPNVKDLKSFVIAAQSQGKNTRLIVVPSSRFIQDKYLNQNSSNLEFILNVTNDIASQGALSGIRSRAISFYPLPDLSDSQKDIFKYGNIFLLPILFGIYGGIRLFFKP